MIKTVATIALPVDEKLIIRKNRIEPEGKCMDIRQGSMPHGDMGYGGMSHSDMVQGDISHGDMENGDISHGDMENGDIPHSDMKRISIVTGIHGDELEGQYVCFELNRRIMEHKDKLNGIVDIYPAMNPLGIDSITRGIPAFDLDMNRLFPGNKDGNMTEYLASAIIKDVAGSDVVIDIHASNIYLTEIPQIRINELHKDRLIPLAMETNVDFIWVHGASTVLESTFAYSLNSTGTPVLVVEMGVGMRITKAYGDQLVDGIFHLMGQMGIWTGDVPAVRTPMISDNPDDVAYLNASTGGLFIPTVRHGETLKTGSLIGHIIDPLSGKVLDEVTAPVDGILFTIREYPIVDEGSLIGRLLRSERNKLPI